MEASPVERLSDDLLASVLSRLDSEELRRTASQVQGTIARAGGKPQAQSLLELPALGLPASPAVSAILQRSLARHSVRPQ